LVYEVVKALKARDHKTLPIYLQSLESYLFIDCIAKELVTNDIIPLTIHDSVIVKTKDQAKTIEIINKVFMEQIGVIPSFDIKNLQSPKTINTQH
jgi:tRNA(Glu) U13 pseudouridine synthase TruD